MVVFLLVLGLLLFPPAGRPADDVGSIVEIGGRDAQPRKAELIGPVEEALVRELVLDDDPALHGGDGAGSVIEVGLAHADHRDVPGSPEDVDAVDVHVGGDAPGGHGGMAREVFRAQRALNASAMLRIAATPDALSWAPL